MPKNIKSDGHSTTVTEDGVQMRMTGGEYSAQTPQRSTTHSANGIVQSGTSRNVEISGNSQETYAGRGITCEYSFKVVGTPELFSGKAQRAADKAVSKLVGILLQSGDDRHSVSPSQLVKLDLNAVMSKMSTSWGGTLAPTPPQITRIQDIGKLSLYLATYIETISLSDAAYKAKVAGLAEVEHQLNQQKETLRQLKKMFDEGEITPEMLAGSPSLEERNAKPNITRSYIYQQIMPELARILANENAIC